MKFFTRTIVIAAMVALLSASITASPALAARGGKAGSGSTTTTTSGATVTFWQNGVQVTSVPVNTSFDIKCSAPGSGVYIDVSGWFNAKLVSTSNCILPSTGFVYFTSPGTYTFDLFTVDSKGNVTYLARAPLTVTQ